MNPLLPALLLTILLAACAPEPAPRWGDRSTATVSHNICAPYDRSLLDGMDPQAQVTWLTERMKTCRAACEAAGTCNDDDTAAMAIDFYNRANAQGELGRHGEAVADYSRSLALDPTFVPAYAQRAMELIAMDRFTEALADADAAIARAPNDPRPHGLRCLVLLELKQHKEALAACATATGLAPGVPALQMIHGMALARDGQEEAALTQMEQAIAADPTVVSVLQEQMRKAGYHAGPASGSYDQATQDALAKWIAAGAPGEGST
jgi:tetratricopeptide (TPR) repeat protein